MKASQLFFAFGAFWLSFVHAEQIACNSTSSCPEDLPCCNQYKVCGVGSYCLGGCDPRYSYSLEACMPQPRMSSFEESFSNIDVVRKQSEYLGNASETDWVYTGYIDSYNDALMLQMPNQSSGSVVSSTKYLWYGRVGATMKSSRDRGVITAFITFSDVQDEIDYEFLGYNLTNPETNFYSQGILNYTNTGTFTVDNSFSSWHNYELDWTEERIQWIVDGAVVRTLEKVDTWNATTNRYDYPDTPSRVQFSLWPGGSTANNLGTIEWAGGDINWDSEDIQNYGYYYAFVKNVSVEVYDLPSYLASSANSSYHAFLYNSTEGDENNVYLTDEKTWLGSSDATGLDPDNDDDDVSETTVVHSSGTSTYTTTKSKSSEQTAKTANNADATTATYTGSGFVQNSKESTTSSSSSEGHAMDQHQFASTVLGLLAMGAAMFFVA